MDPIMIGLHTIINDENNCLLSPSIKCNNDNSYYSSKILPNLTTYNNYIKDYNENVIMDKENKYLIKLTDKCNIQQNKINECTNLQNIDNNNIKNIITEESYSLQDYIDHPELLKEFIENENNFLKIFLSEFKNLFEGLIILNKKGISHLKIHPKNLIFNQQTKKIKFIDFGEKINKMFLINNYFNKNRTYKYDFNIYYPFICFFINYSNYKIYKKLTREENTNFINFLKHIFFDETYIDNNSIHESINLLRLKEQFTIKIRENNEKFIKYKSYIQHYYTNDKTKFFNGILTYNTNNHIRNTIYKSFIKYTINSVDIYGLSISLLIFSKMLKTKYFIDSNAYNELLSCLNELAINIPSSKIERTCIPEKSFTYFKKKYYKILEYLEKKQQPTNIKINTNISQYKLKLSDITTYYGNSNKQYINYNEKLMRAFNTQNIFTHLNNLSSHNYSIIKKIIDENLSSINKLIILIDKEAYYKIKHNLYCSDNKEVNIYTKRCVTKCPKDYIRNFNDRNFRCTRKNIKNKNINDKIIEKNKIIKKNKIIEKNKNKKTKKCPSGYEKNPFTKTCTRKCPSGYIRNLKFNCIAEKDIL